MSLREDRLEVSSCFVWSVEVCWMRTYWERRRDFFTWVETFIHAWHSHPRPIVHAEWQTVTTSIPSTWYVTTCLWCSEGKVVFSEVTRWPFDSLMMLFLSKKLQKKFLQQSWTIAVLQKRSHCHLRLILPELGSWVRTAQDFKAVTSIHLVCTIYLNTLVSTMLQRPLKPTANLLKTESRRVVPSRTPHGWMQTEAQKEKRKQPKIAGQLFQYWIMILSSMERKRPERY